MINYDDRDWLILTFFRVRGSVAGKACWFAVPSALLSLGLLIMDDEDPNIRLDSSLNDLSSGTAWSALTVCLFIMVNFRTSRAMGRFWEGTGLMHQMRGEWFDTVSNCVTFSTSARITKPEEVMRFRHTLVRMMSLAHGHALEEIAGYQFVARTIDPNGLEPSISQFLKSMHEDCNFNKVEVDLHLIQSLITRANAEGLLQVPPPIVSRVFQTISRGFVNLLNTKKITDTKFPYPHVQLLIFLMLSFSCFTPIFLTNVITNKFVAMAVTFLPNFAVASLYQIAVELENPFGADANDLPLEHFQSEMDNCLLMLLHPDADIVPTVTPTCGFDFYSLMNEFQPAIYRNGDYCKNNLNQAEMTRQAAAQDPPDSDPPALFSPIIPQEVS
mmetsp:Transcript_98795/g.175941  ORF Transcript_98795/g.175941 Transcript_98795/m.175941 type:complete len:386 (+) Transcript_98795:32-1189(+)